MKELLTVMVADDSSISVTTEFEFPADVRKQVKPDRNQPLYLDLVQALQDSGPDTHYAIRLLESARRDARYQYQGLHPELEAALLSWRREKARGKDVPAYYILHQRVLLAIADTAPATADDLLAVPGFGPSLFARYGAELLDLVHNTHAHALPADSI
ncbi:MAG: HRDC domain-containing protein [Bacteroidales bacterium]|nr:HRDC domain-containing protein [Bacteroidales bacterium]